MHDPTYRSCNCDRCHRAFELLKLTADASRTDTKLIELAAVQLVQTLDNEVEVIERVLRGICSTELLARVVAALGVRA